MSSLVKHEKFDAGMDGALLCVIMQLVLAGLPTTRTCKSSKHKTVKLAVIITLD